MKRKLVFAACFAVALPALGADYVRGHVRKDGTYVQPHFRSSPNDSRHDNYSTRGNTNPYTGERGSVDAFAPRQPSYGIEPIRPISPISPIEPIRPYGSERRRGGLLD